MSKGESVTADEVAKDLELTESQTLWLKAQIEALLNEARIDELKRFDKATDTRHFDDVMEERIAQLEHQEQEAT